MTAKQALRQLVDRLDESQAEALLKVAAGTFPSDGDRLGAPTERGPHDVSIWEEIQEIVGTVPKEERNRVPSYGSPSAEPTPTAKLITDLRAMWVEVPEGEMARMASSENVDRVVYGNPHGLQ